MQKWLKAVQPHVSGVFMEMYDPNEYHFLMRRLWMRLLWNPDLDVNAEIDDVCKHFYGPAGATMAEFYKLLIARYEMPWQKPKLTWDQYYLDNDLYFGQSYTPEVVDRLAGLLETARRQAGIAAQRLAIALRRRRLLSSLGLLAKARGEPLVGAARLPLLRRRGFRHGPRARERQHLGRALCQIASGAISD